MTELARVRGALFDALRAYGRERLELEFRVGHRAGGAFVPGVSEAAWRAVKARLDASPAFAVVVAHSTEHICDDGSGAAAKYVRPQGGQAYWMHKKRLADVDMPTRQAPWCCRASLSLEVVDPPGRPPPAKPAFQRQKERFSYVHRCWSVDLTRVVSNLPHQLDNDGVSYEIEVELKDTAELFSRPADNVLEWAWAIVNDLCAMPASS